MPVCGTFLLTVLRDIRIVKGNCALFVILVDEKNDFVVLKTIAAYDSSTKLKLSAARIHRDVIL